MQRKGCFFVIKRSRVQVMETASLQSKGNSAHDRRSFPDRRKARSLVGLRLLF